MRNVTYAVYFHHCIKDLLTASIYTHQTLMIREYVDSALNQNQ